MKKILLFSVILFFTSFCKSKGNTIRHRSVIRHKSLIEQITKHPSWSACFRKDLNTGGVHPKSIKHTLTFTDISDSTFSLEWQSTAYIDTKCIQELTGITKATTLILKEISIQADENFFHIGKTNSGKPIHEKIDENMMPPFKNFKKLQFMEKNFLVHFKSTNEELKIFYKKAPGGEFEFASPEESGSESLTFTP